jgi:nitrite reductase/ring-hydroxylating ferredoxin subunit
MTTSGPFVPASELLASGLTRALPRECTFTETDWRALAPFWYPVALSHEVTNKPLATRLLDERVVVYRLASGSVSAARDICYHRGVPLSLGYVDGDEIVCKYHGLRYDPEGHCTCIPAHPGGAISPRLRLDMYQAQERDGLVWVRRVDDGPRALPEMDEWYDQSYLQVRLDSVDIKAAAGRQVEGFLDVSHFAFVHKESFGEPGNPVVPDYKVTMTKHGFVADYVSTVSPSVSLLLEIEMVMVSASRIEHRATARALVGTGQVLSCSQLYSACPTQDCRLIPFRLWPDFDCMAG